MNENGPISNRSDIPPNLRDKLRQDGRALCQFAAEMGAGLPNHRTSGKRMYTAGHSR